MSRINHNDQDSKYGQLAHKLLEIASISGREAAVYRHSGKSESSTELLHEIGTTDIAIGDATAEVMITTLGKIPNEMYYLEDTSTASKLLTRKLYSTAEVQQAVGATTQAYKNTNGESSSHSTTLIILLTALLLILLLCCISACFMARSKRKNTLLGNGDGECEPGCTGMRQPLLEKVSSSTNKTSASSLRN